MTTLTPSPGPSTSTPPPPPPTTTFTFPPHHSFPPFYTLQPNLTTQARQLALWSTLIQSYCRHEQQHKLSVSGTATSPLFSNAAIHRSLDPLTVRRILDFMASADGDARASWADDAKTAAYVWWRPVAEWGDAIYAWVDATGQRGSVLTVYELREGDAVAGQGWTGMDEPQFRCCVEGLVKRGKAQIFGQQDGAGVKFF